MAGIDVEKNEEKRYSYSEDEECLKKIVIDLKACLSPSEQHFRHMLIFVATFATWDIQAC